MRLRASKNRQRLFRPCTFHLIPRIKLQITSDCLLLRVQARASKTLFKRRTRSLPSFTHQALNYLVKGCQMTMHNATLLTHENRELRAANEKQERARRRTYLATGSV